MKIFGITFTTKKELKAKNVVLMDEIEGLLEAFPLRLGQVVYDVALKNDKGRYTKIKPSLEYSTINEVVVDKKNYFKLVERLERKDVHRTKAAAEEHIKAVCI